jgi:large subunit ribosomal protein L29
VSKQVEAVNSLRTMTTADLDEHLRQQRRRLFEVRFQQAAGQVENHRQVRELRREIARTMTIQLELARGHHLVSDLEVEEAPAEQAPDRGPGRGGRGCGAGGRRSRSGGAGGGRWFGRRRRGRAGAGHEGAPSAPGPGGRGAGR